MSGSNSALVLELQVGISTLEHFYKGVVTTIEHSRQGSALNFNEVVLLYEHGFYDRSRFIEA